MFKRDAVQATSHPLLWNLLKTAGMAGTVAAQAQLKRPALGFLRDHSVRGRTILPGAAMFEMAMAFGKVTLSPTTPCTPFFVALASPDRVPYPTIRAAVVHPAPVLRILPPHTCTTPAG